MMKFLYLLLLGLLLLALKSHAQQTEADRTAIGHLVKNYSKYVLTRDSTAFYKLFNNDQVTWCAGLIGESRLTAQNSLVNQRTYFSSSYQSFMRGLFAYRSTEDKFDHIRILSDGGVASVIMDYSFWANGVMTNWGRKQLMLIRKSDGWKIAAVNYSIELTADRKQPTLKIRSLDKN